MLKEITKVSGRHFWVTKKSSQLMKKTPPGTMPIFEGGNLVVDLNEYEYRRGVENLKFSVVGKIYLSKGSSLPTTVELRNKLA